MDDRIAEIREALRQWDAGELLQSDIARLAAAARAYADLLESDALIIRRDENGEWPEWALKAAEPFEVFLAGDGHNSIRGKHPSDVLDALASSQGVEP